MAPEETSVDGFGGLAAEAPSIGEVSVHSEDKRRHQDLQGANGREELRKAVPHCMQAGGAQTRVGGRQLTMSGVRAGVACVLALRTWPHGDCGAAAQSQTAGAQNHTKP